MTQFTLDPRLAADTLPVAELGLSSLRLMNDRRYPWAILVPRRAGCAEIHDLCAADQRLLLEEITLVSRSLSSLAAAHKMNVAALGNIVRQLHVHVVARRAGDEAWPHPVWSRGAMSPYAADEGAALARRLAAAVTTSP
ncbi:MAG: HIT domain-containing protein [Parvularculaceae bacterium]|nr:HIT domain-containing protein [Parvularculaceae bacterium]